MVWGFGVGIWGSEFGALGLGPKDRLGPGVSGLAREP